MMQGLLDLFSCSSCFGRPLVLHEDGPVPESVYFIRSGATEQPIPRIEVPLLDLEEVRSSTGNFARSSLIDSGAHSDVYSAVLSHNMRVVVKKLKEPGKQVSKADFMKQISIASQLNHENIVKMHGYYVSNDLCILAYEFAPMGSLQDVLHGRDGAQEPQTVLSWIQRLRIAIDAAKGLEYLHGEDRSIVHKKVRPSNIMLFEEYKAKIADYNLFEHASEVGIGDAATKTMSTAPYHAPEFMMGEAMTTKSDVYSFGVVLLELLTGRKPLVLSREAKQRSLVNWATPLIEQKKVEECVDQKLGRNYSLDGATKLGLTALQCLKPTRQERPEMSKVVRSLEHIIQIYPGSVS